MAAKKPSAKATKAKKTVAKKADSAKKAVHAKKAVPRAKPAAARPAPKPVHKPVPAAAQAKPAKVAVAVEPVIKPAVKPASAKPVSVKPASPPSPSASARATIATRTMPATNDDAGGEGEDADAVESPSTNLLAGPRNVKPYIARRGEQYMGKAQLEHFRQILNTWKRDLMTEVDRTVLHMKDEAANFPDPNDRATQESEFSLELRTRDRERKLIRKIDEALKRIDDGSYGYCNETGEEIGIKRLEARPVATLSLEAQERRERREKQYGDRDDRYR
jgi:DnaK suppressor protein